MTRWSSGASFSAPNRYGLVVILIMFTYIASAAASGPTAESLVLLLQLLAVRVVFGVSESPRARRIAGVVTTVGLVVTLLGLVVGGMVRVAGLEQVLFGVSLLLYLVAPVIIVRHIFRRPQTDLQTLLGAIAAYMLIGMFFAFAYRSVAAVQTDPPFFGSSGKGTMSQDLFYSFVTLTTTGYGDLVPQANPGQTLGVMEAILGQLFLVTAVAKVVTGWKTIGEQKARENSETG